MNPAAAAELDPRAGAVAHSRAADVVADGAQHRAKRLVAARSQRGQNCQTLWRHADASSVPSS
jgi:hypothetical protein